MYEEEERHCVLELLVTSLMLPDSHSSQSSERTSYCSKTYERSFGYTPCFVLCLFLVQSVDDKCHYIDQYQIAGYQLFGRKLHDIHTRFEKSLFVDGKTKLICLLHVFGSFYSTWTAHSNSAYRTTLSRIRHTHYETTEAIETPLCSLE